MNLIEKLNSINRPPIPPLQLNHAYNMDELRGQLLNMYNVDKNIVLQWHKLLMDYVKMDHAMLAIRGYNSFLPDKYDCLRRGFLTRAESFSYFHTDNYFAAYFLKMCMDGYLPELSEFYDLMTTRQFPSRFGQITSKEKELMAIKQGKDPGINHAGFKLAHIIPVGKEYLINGRTMGMQEILNKYFPIGQRADWKLHSDKFGTYYMRELDETSPDMKKIAIAHFLRFVHPFNYFICPKKACEENSMHQELAEYQPLLDNMHDYMLQTYGDAYKEYLSYILVDEKYSNDMYKVDGEVKVGYGLILQHRPDIKQRFKELLDTNSQGEINETVEQEDTNDSNHKHSWAVEGDEYCVRLVFYHFVCNYSTLHDVLSIIYDYFEGQIDTSSIRKKLQTIKYLLNEAHISNTLNLQSLKDVSYQCRKVFEQVYAEYKKNGNRINDPMNDPKVQYKVKDILNTDSSSSSMQGYNSDEELTQPPHEHGQKKNTLIKDEAATLFEKKGYAINEDHTTYASKNQTGYTYWANPKFYLLRQNWYLILNDWPNRTLYLFSIPANSISESELVPRKDKPDIIDLEIYYKDPTFTDSRSKYSFLKYKVDEINY